MSTKYYIQDNRIVRCSDLKSFKNTEEFLMSEVKDLERQLDEEKAKSKALLVGLEVQNLDDFIALANVENYKKLGENITIGFKTQLKEQGDDE